MNKNLLLVLIVVCMIPGILSIGRGIDSISGNMVYTQVSPTSLVVLYFIAATIALGFALIALIKTYGHESQHKSGKQNNKNIFKNIEFKVGLHPHSAFGNHIKNSLKPEQIMVLTVAAVGLIAIGIILSSI